MIEPGRFEEFFMFDLDRIKHDFRESLKKHGLELVEREADLQDEMNFFTK